MKYTVHRLGDPKNKYSGMLPDIQAAMVVIALLEHESPGLRNLLEVSEYNRKKRIRTFNPLGDCHGFADS